MATTNTMSNAPLWLDIKTEYIDENFEKVLEYLFKAFLNQDRRDSFYKLTLDLLQKRVSNLLDELANRPVFEDEELSKNKEAYEARHKFVTRILGLYLLVNSDLQDWHWVHVSMAMNHSLSQLVPLNFSQELIETGVKIILGKVERTSLFAWNDIINFQPQILAHKIVSGIKSSNKNKFSASLYKQGSLSIAKGTMKIAAMGRIDFLNKNLAQSIGIFDEQIQVLSEKEDKVKKSEATDINKLEEFARNFILDQRKIREIKQTQKHYEIGDKLRVVITGFSEKGILVESLDSDYEKFTGTVLINQSLLYYDYSDFRKYLQVGDEIQVNILGIKNSTCSINDEFSSFIIDERACEDFGNEVLAMYMEDNTDRNGLKKIVWLTDRGYPAYSFNVEGIERGEFAYIRIVSHGQDRFFSYINAEFLEKTEENFEYDIIRKECIESFTFEPACKSSDNDANTLSPVMVSELCRILYTYQQKLTQPSERYRILAVARFLAELTGNENDSSYLNFVSSYLLNLVLFAKGEIEHIKLPSTDEQLVKLESVQRRMELIRLLQAYGNDECNDYLGEVISGTQDELLKKVAVLVQSCNRIDHVISKSMQNVIKREIIKSLSIDMAGEADLEEGNGSYLGIENSRQEFKTSFFHAPANAKEQNQHLTIFKGVCAFLNSQAGGTLFLGVNDLGYVKGVASDIEYMEKTVVSGNYHGIDGYIRYITDEAKKYFDLGVLTHIRIEPMYDNNVVAINALPYEYNVVSLEGVSYIRLNSETVVLTEQAKRQLFDKRVFSNTEKSANVNNLLEAVRNKRQVVLHNYSSSSSGEVSDRTVEPFALTTGYTHAWCYDIDKKRNSVFRAERIGSVEILKDMWENEDLHREEKMDAFHMTGDDSIHAVLKLDLMAKNLLCEEYPDARTSLSSTGDGWTLDIKVQKIEGLARFYMGLASHISIVDCPELNQYVKDYSRKYLV